MRSVVIIVNIPHLDGGASLLLAAVFAGVEQFFGEDAVVSFYFPLRFGVYGLIRWYRGVPSKAVKSAAR